MIVPMLHVDLLATAGAKEQALEALRSMGAVHLDLSGAGGAGVVAARGRAARAERAVRVIRKARESLEYADTLTLLPCNVDGVLELEEKRADSEARLAAAEKEIARVEPYGDFDPALAAKLVEKTGGRLRDVASLPDPLPAKSLSELRAEAAEMKGRLLETVSALAASDEESILSQYAGLADALAFEAAKEKMEASGAVAHIAGWLPAPREGEMLAAARREGWGVLLRGREPGETPPTLVEPPRLFRPVKALFAGLGVSPCYDEADVSVPFMCYFSLFFAMLVGDGAYGALFLAATVALRRKLPRSWFVLLTVFSSATVVWGILSNTWFGAALPWCASWPTVRWLADPSYRNMMLLCFTIGASHLILARLWNAVCRAPDSTALAELGWAGVLLAMYLVVNTIVGIFPAVPGWGAVVGGTSVALVFLFSVKPSELKTRGAELGMLPLNIMSALGDIISYVRLFAVGLASVKVAENFNAMAVNLFDGAPSALGKALAAVAMVAILAVGHGINIMMAGLSVLVHAVRLNTLEFSNHKGVTWGGYAYSPFRKQARDDNKQGGRK